MARAGWLVSKFDEDSISGRPLRGNTRRRTKDRPDFSKAEVGQVIGVDRGRITCLVPAGERFENQVQVTTVKARELGRKGVVIGDRCKIQSHSFLSIHNQLIFFGQ